MFKKALIFMGLLAITGCVERERIDDPLLWGKEGEATSKITVVSMLLPLSGESASVGEEFQNAAMMASMEKQSPIKIVFFDTKGTPAGAESAYAQALRQDPSLILGPIFSGEVHAISDTKPKIPLLTYTSDSTELNNNISTMAMLIPDQIQRLVRYACSEGKRQIAVLAPENKTGKIAMNTLDESVKLCPGMEIKFTSLYSASTNNFGPPILKILPKIINPKKKDLTEEEQELLATPMSDRLEFDGLFIFEDGVKLRQIITLLAFYDVTPKMVPMYGLATIKSVNERSLAGIYFTDLNDRNYTDFERRYNRMFGKKPLRLTSQAYDSIAWISQLASHEIVTLKKLQQTDLYTGIDGTIKLNTDGTNRRGLRIMQRGPHRSYEIQRADDITIPIQPIISQSTE